MNIIVTGGFEANFTVGFARGLAANGMELCVISCDETAARLTAVGIRNVNLRGSLAENRSSWIKLTNLVSYYARLLWLLFRNRGATIHFTGIFRNHFILWEGLVLNACFRLLAGKYIYTVHNVLPHSRERSPLFRWIYRRIYQLPHVLLVHTQRARQQLVEEFGVAEGRIRLTSIGLNEEMPLTSMSPAEARHRLGFGEQEQLVLFFGKIDEYKGLDLLLAAFDRLNGSSIRLVVAGAFRNQTYRCTILEQLSHLKRRNEICLHERFIPNEEAEVFFKACDVLCLPYRNIYQSGLVFLAPHFGIPMITTDVGSLREFVESDFGIVTRTNDAAGIADAIESFMAAPTLFSRIEILHRAQKYRWASVCRDLVPLYAGASSGSSISRASRKLNQPDPDAVNLN
ncbi:MAG: glycosyl transferase [Verrucomicrobiales bacterium]|nr:glycosyl transferase [Verrucomicrobiales bacterium]